jgi:peptidoglycan/LPS O-acetylase OafA/YrhL
MKKNQTGITQVYFENINAIRFIAALFVIIHHTEQIKDIFHIPYWHSQVQEIIGKLGVVLFFVLSGFLISYLLFKEQEITKTIDIKFFYIRRMLRIWPLYFLIIFSAFFILPFIDIFKVGDYGREMVWQDLFYKLLLYLFFLPNLVVILLGTVPYAALTWSIGVEEQFYLVWPILNKYVKNKWLLMVSVIFFYLLVKLFFYLLPANVYLSKFWESMAIDCMAIGGLFALLIYEKNAFANLIQRIIFSKSCQILTLILTTLLIANGYRFPYLHYECYAILFGILICNFAFNKQRIFSMEYRWLNYLGKISYGLYVFHPIAIVLSIRLMQYFNIQSNYLLYFLVFTFVILIASLSYKFFEKNFINIKVKYSKILSGDNAH